jgi:hypothetical protein
MSSLIKGAYGLVENSFFNLIYGGMVKGAYGLVENSFFDSIYGI